MQLFNGDCLEKLKELENCSVDSIVTDPPYGLSFMGKRWDYDVPSVAILKEALRVLKPGGHLLSFGGTRTYHRMVVNIEDAGFEIRDCIQWLYGSGFPKSHNLKEQWQGWGTALKPANEPIVVARKPLEKRLTVAENVIKWGCGALNIDGSRVNNSKWDEEENLCNSCADNVKNKTKHIAQVSREFIATKSAEPTLNENQTGYQDTLKMDIGCSEEMSQENTNINLNTFISGKEKTDQNQKDSSSITSTKTKKTIGSKTCSLCQSQITLNITGASGRWPSNLILDEAAAEMLDEQSGPYKTGGRNIKTKCGVGFFKVDVNQTLATDNGSGASRFFYVAKASKSERNAGLEGMPLVEKRSAGGTTSSGKPTMQGRDRFGSQTQNFHPTVKPIKLMQYLINLVTPPNGTVLDPFMGSGSTGVAAKNLGFKFVGIELSAEYFEIAKKRIL